MEYEEKHRLNEKGKFIKERFEDLYYYRSTGLSYLSSSENFTFSGITSGGENVHVYETSDMHKITEVIQRQQNQINALTEILECLLSDAYN